MIHVKFDEIIKNVVYYVGYINKLRPESLAFVFSFDEPQKLGTLTEYNFPFKV